MFLLMKKLGLACCYMVTSLVFCFVFVFLMGSGRERGRDQERTTSWDLNSNHQKCNCATCRRDAHETIGSDNIVCLFFKSA